MGSLSHRLWYLDYVRVLGLLLPSYSENKESKGIHLGSLYRERNLIDTMWRRSPQNRKDICMSDKIRK